jgi:endonuclease G
MTLLKLTALLVALIPLLRAQKDRFGAPACHAPDRELADRSFFFLCHSASRRVPVWVGYELKPEHLRRLTTRPSRFRHDAQLAGPKADDSDYRGSGFSRGHMAPAADFAWSEQALRATFLLSNAVPQYQRTNAGRWAQLEAAVRRIAAASDAVYVFTGPIFEGPNTEVIGSGQVAVPSHTYKVILALKGDLKRMYAAIVPNAAGVSEPLNRLAATVEDVERRSGLDFFSALEDSEERHLESSWRPFPTPTED